MKRAVLALLILHVSVFAFAADFSFSVGAGGLAGYAFTRYTLTGGAVKSTQSMDRFDYGGFVFFDAAYAELSVLFQGGRNSYSENMISDTTSLTEGKGTGNELSFGFSLMGKYPFTINEKITWFPMLGAEYQIALRQWRKPDGGNIVYDRSAGKLVEDRDKDGNPYPLSAWNSFWINIGAGLDYGITDFLFLRGELIFGFRLPTGYENGALEVVKNPPMNVKDPKLSGLTGSPKIKIGMGYRF